MTVQSTSPLPPGPRADEKVEKPQETVQSRSREASEVSRTSRLKELEKTLLRPTTLSPEERMKQVISLEDIKQLLMIARPYPDRYEVGHFLSLRA